MTSIGSELRTVLLAGRTATVEWASLLLRNAGRDVRLVELSGDHVTVRSVWSDGQESEFTSIDDAIASLDAAALVVDLDDRGLGIESSTFSRGALQCAAVVVSAFGRIADAPLGSDLAVSAASGVLHLSGASGDPEGRPLPVHEHHTESIAGSYVAIAALLAADHGTPGQLVELTKHECFSICAAGEVTKWTYAGLVPSRLGSPLFQPSSIMPAADGDIFVLCTSEEQWERLMMAMGDPEWSDWEIFADRGLRGEHWDVLQPRLGEWVAGQTRDQLMEVALSAKLPFALALSPPEVESLEEELADSNKVADWLYRITPGPSATPCLRNGDLAHPLKDVVVLDLSTVWATPLSTAQLAHLGARVIKVETHTHMDHTRARLGELSQVDIDLPEWDRKGSFRETNQGKESVTLNLREHEGRRLFMELVKHADVVISNFTPGVAERLGLSTESLWSSNPSLVIGRFSAYQPHSRLASLTGFGYAMLLACGFGYQGDSEPWLDRSIAYPDPQAGFVLAFAVINAIEERGRSGRGALIEVDLFGPSAALHRYFADIPLDSARGFDLPKLVFSESLPCLHDEWIVVSCSTLEEVQLLVDVLGIDGPQSGESSRDLARRLAQRSAHREAQQLQDELRALNLVAQRVLDVKQLVREGGLVDSGLFRVPEGEHHLHAASPLVLDGKRIDSNRRAPYLGEHTTKVLGELLRLSPDEVADLEARKIAW